MSTVLDWRIIATTARGFAQTRFPPKSFRDGEKPVKFRHTIVSTAGGIDVEASENFSRGTIKAKDDLNRAVGVLACSECQGGIDVQMEDVQ